MAEEFGPDALRAKAIQKAKEQMLKDSSRIASGQRTAQREDRKRRDAAEENDAKSPVFLRPGDITGDYNFSRLLTTTLGGIRRPITADDLAAFAKNIETLKEKYTRGISPRDVIEFSLASDREKSNSEIFLCSPFKKDVSKDGSVVVRFITNASLESKSARHYVSVQLNDYSKFATSTKKTAGQLTRERLINSGVKFECDCGRHTYFFRYLATAAGYALGRQELGYPKIRNPNLYGVACKHVLRVMHYMVSPLGIQYLRKQIDKDRAGQLKTAAETEKMIMDRLAELEGISGHENQKVRPRHEVPGHIRRMVTEAAKKAERKEIDDARASYQASEAAADKARLRGLVQAGVLKAAEYKRITGENP